MLSTMLIHNYVKYPVYNKLRNCGYLWGNQTYILVLWVILLVVDVICQSLNYMEMSL